MEALIKVASYIARRYQKEFGCFIDEMKLHKLLYFAQRESFIQLGEPLFAEEFQAWKYGPVMVDIRQSYSKGLLTEKMSVESESKYKDVFDTVFHIYAKKDSWSLSILSHGEYSCQTARKGIPSASSCSNVIETSDIKKDAEIIKQRRFLISELEKNNRYEN